MQTTTDSPKTLPASSVGSGALLGEYARCGWRRAWIMWDLDNGHAHSKTDPGKGYLWVFSTRENARSHRKKQHANEGNARLSLPFKIEGER